MRPYRTLAVRDAPAKHAAPQQPSSHKGFYCFKGLLSANIVLICGLY
jgi:hypothetical protein